MFLSSSAQVLLLRLSFVSSAILLAYAIYDNFLFWHLFPFYMQLAADILCAAFFVWAAVYMRIISAVQKSILVYGAAIAWTYIVLTNAYGLYWYVQVLGTNHIAQSTGSLAAFLAYEGALTTVVPALLFGWLWWILRKL